MRRDEKIRRARADLANAMERQGRTETVEEWCIDENAIDAALRRLTQLGCCADVELAKAKAAQVAS